MPLVEIGFVLQGNDGEELGREIRPSLSFGVHTESGPLPNQAASAGARSPGRELQQLAVPSCTHLAFLQDVPQQREVLCSEVPERLHIAALNEGYQVEVFELWRGRNRGGGGRRLQHKAGGGSSTVQSFLGCAVMSHTYLLTSFTNLQLGGILVPNPSNVA